MAEYNLTCIVCQHGPHANGKCMNCECRVWQRADVQAARALTNINNILVQEIPKLTTLLVDMVALMVEVNPEAAARVDAKREEMRQQQEQEAKEQENKNEQDIDNVSTATTVD